MDDLESMTVDVVQLKDKLCVLNLPVTGVKSELIIRIRDAEIGDSISNVVSAVSTTASAKAIAAAKGAALLVLKLASLKKKQMLEEQELRLKQQKEELEVETQLAMASAEEETLAQFEGSLIPKPNLTQEPMTSAEEVTSAQLEYLRPNVPQQQHTGVDMKVLLETLQLPQAEHLTFDGNPLNYFSFIQEFKNNVDSTSISDGNKLTRLINCCRGKAKQLIMCCAVMSPSEGCKRAFTLLEERFGASYLIADSHVTRLLQFDDVSSQNRVLLQEFADQLLACKETLKATGHLHEISSQNVLVQLASKLPYYLKLRWMKKARDIRKSTRFSPNIEQFVTFVLEAASEVNDPVYGALCDQKKKPNINDKINFRKSSNFNATVGKLGKSSGNLFDIDCIFCTGKKHFIFKCDKFKDKSVYDRIKFVRTHKLCFNCLFPGHIAKDCKYDRVCNVRDCGKKHSTLVHVERGILYDRSVNTDDRQISNVPQNPSEQKLHLIEPKEVFSNYSNESCYHSILRRVALPILPVKIRPIGGSTEVFTYALLNTGSTSSFCTEYLRTKLNITGRKTKLTLSTLNEGPKSNESEVIGLEVQGVDQLDVITIPHVYTSKRLNINMTNAPQKDDLKHWPHLNSLKLSSIESDVHLLIGQDIPSALMPLEVIRSGEHEPYASRTVLGWVLNGPLTKEADNETHTEINSSNYVNIDEQLNEQLECFWKIDGMDSVSRNKEAMSVDEKGVIELWERTTTMDNRHYQMDIPFKESPPKFTINYGMVRHRLKLLKNRLDKDPDLKKVYSEHMEDLMRQGYAEIVPGDELHRNGAVWYLPHHPVIQPQKGGKLRIVFDCAAKLNGQSLNKNVFQGPDLMNKLLGVLCRFRQNYISLMGDIKGMFHQVKVKPDHRDVLCFLWWPTDDFSEEPKVFRMTVHLFRGCWSPSCCSFALQKTVKDHSERFSSKVSTTVQKNFYVDDCLVSVDDETEGTGVTRPRRLQSDEMGQQ